MKKNWVCLLLCWCLCGCAPVIGAAYNRHIHADSASGVSGSLRFASMYTAEVYASVTKEIHRRKENGDGEMEGDGVERRVRLSFDLNRIFWEWWLNPAAPQHKSVGVWVTGGLGYTGEARFGSEGLDLLGYDVDKPDLQASAGPFLIGKTCVSASNVKACFHLRWHPPRQVRPIFTVGVIVPTKEE